jgi:hypothetical protein
MPDPRGLLPTLRAAGLLCAARAARGRVRVDEETRLIRRLASLPLGRTPVLARTLAAHRRVDRALGALCNCLDRSVALWADLDASGHAPELRFGVRQDDAFEAHAWVELDGEVLLDDAGEVATYAPFDGDLGRRFA